MSGRWSACIRSRRMGGRWKMRDYAHGCAQQVRAGEREVWRESAGSPFTLATSRGGGRDQSRSLQEHFLGVLFSSTAVESLLPFRV